MIAWRLDGTGGRDVERWVVCGEDEDAFRGGAWVRLRCVVLMGMVDGGERRD